jgi:hypothetical protein
MDGGLRNFAENGVPWTEGRPVATVIVVGTDKNHSQELLLKLDILIGFTTRRIVPCRKYALLIHAFADSTMPECASAVPWVRGRREDCHRSTEREQDLGFCRILGALPRMP